MNQPDLKKIEVHCIGETTKQAIPKEFLSKVSSIQSLECLVRSLEED